MLSVAWPQADAIAYCASEMACNTAVVTCSFQALGSGMVDDWQVDMDAYLGLWDIAATINLERNLWMILRNYFHDS